MADESVLQKIREMSTRMKATEEKIDRNQNNFDDLVQKMKNSQMLKKNKAYADAFNDLNRKLESLKNPQVSASIPQEKNGEASGEQRKEEKEKRQLLEKEIKIEMGEEFIQEPTLVWTGGEGEMEGGVEERVEKEMEKGKAELPLFSLDPVMKMDEEEVEKINAEFEKLQEERREEERLEMKRLSEERKREEKERLVQMGRRQSMRKALKKSEQSFEERDESGAGEPMGKETETAAKPVTPTGTKGKKRGRPPGSGNKKKATKNDEENLTPVMASKPVKAKKQCNAIPKEEKDGDGGKREKAKNSNLEQAEEKPPLLDRYAPSGSIAATPEDIAAFLCEICDKPLADKEQFLQHVQAVHKQKGRMASVMQNDVATLSCSSCGDKFWTYEGLERHLLMSHSLVSYDLLEKAKRKGDGGRCKICSKQYSFNLLAHMATGHGKQLCSVGINYTCDVCSVDCESYRELNAHLAAAHPKNAPSME